MVAVSVAEFVWTAQLATVVALVTWIATFAPGARLTGEHVNDCGAPEIEQPAGPEAIAAIKESTGLEDGKQWDKFFAALDKDGSPTAYLFKCSKCGQLGGYQDCG